MIEKSGYLKDKNGNKLNIKTIAENVAVKDLNSYYSTKNLESILIEIQQRIISLDQALTALSGTSAANAFTSELRAKLEGIEEFANKYIHPDTHPAGMIETDKDHQFISQADLDNLKSIDFDAFNDSIEEAIKTCKEYTDVLTADAPEDLNTFLEVANKLPKTILIDDINGEVNTKLSIGDIGIFNTTKDSVYYKCIDNTSSNFLDKYEPTTETTNIVKTFSNNEEAASDTSINIGDNIEIVLQTTEYYLCIDPNATKWRDCFYYLSNASLDSQELTSSINSINQTIEEMNTVLNALDTRSITVLDFSDEEFSNNVPIPLTFKVGDIFPKRETVYSTYYICINPNASTFNEKFVKTQPNTLYDYEFLTEQESLENKTIALNDHIRINHTGIVYYFCSNTDGKIIKDCFSKLLSEEQLNDIYVKKEEFSNYIIQITQAEYDALTDIDPNKVYIIKD